MFVDIIRHDWTLEEVKQLFQWPLLDLIYQAQTVHRKNSVPNQVQKSTLLNIKTGACPEDCAYCPQSGHYSTGLKKEPLMKKEDVLKFAHEAKAHGATRFCMGAAWRNPPKREFDQILEMIQTLKSLNLEICITIGMLTEEQATALKEVGLDYYNHNLDTSPEYYPNIITTRTYQDRLTTLDYVRKAGIKVCCGGIIGMGETQRDRMNLLLQLANLPEHPHSVPINQLVPIPGTPLEKSETLDPFEFVRIIAIARLMMPKSWVRLSAGREKMSDELQALSFLAGANSIHFGEKLLITQNPTVLKDEILLNRLGLTS